MSEALGKPWIETSVTRALVEHAHELPSPAELKGRAQIVRFLTFREDSGDRKQPADRDTVLWAEITDRQWMIVARIANEVTNKFEDEHKRALTYFRRGFFTLTAALTYDFVTEQARLPGGTSRIQRSNRKSLILDVVELNYISGGGDGAPIASNSVVLQTCPILKVWEDNLTIGGQTLLNHQLRAKLTLESARKGKAVVRRTASNSTGKTENKGSAKTSTSAHPHQPPSNDKLGAFHQWQDAYWGRRHKYRDMNFEFPRGEFEVPADQQAILEQIVERIKSATSSQPYNPAINSTSGPLSAPDRRNDLPSFRSSQIYTSTPLDAQRTPTSPAMSQAPYQLEDEANEPNLRDEDEDGRSEISLAQQVRSPASDAGDDDGSRAASEVSEPPDSDAEDVERDPQLLSQPDHGSERSLEPDDAVSEKILSTSTHNTQVTETETLIGSQLLSRQPIVLVPDSDPQGSSQIQTRPTQVRGSSPIWEIESSIPSRTHSPEVAKLNKGKRHFSPVLSSPVPQPSRTLEPSQPSGQSIGQQRGTASSGQSTSQESAAAASLPSPPPEHPPMETTFSQAHTRFAIPITNEPTIHDDDPTRDERAETPFDQVPEAGSDVQPTPNPRKRRRSLSQAQDGGLTLASIGGVAVTTRDPEAEIRKRRRVGGSDAHLTAESVISREDTPETRAAQTDSAKVTKTSANHSDLNLLNTQGERATPRSPQVVSPSDPTVIPHNHDAWIAPSYLTGQTRLSKGSVAKEGVGRLPQRAPTSPPAAPTTKSTSRKSHNLKPRFAPLPPFSRSTFPRATSPPYPQVTASQVADADEDVEMLSSPATIKVEPPTPARPTKSRASILSTVPSRRRTSISYAGSKSTNELPPPILKKVARKSTATVADQPSSAGANIEGRVSGFQEYIPSKPRASVHDNSNGKPAKKGKGRGTDSLPGELSGQRKLLGGFRPSVLPSLDKRFISTWDMWLALVREAEVFWQEEDSDPEL